MTVSRAQLSARIVAAAMRWTAESESDEPANEESLDALFEACKALRELATTVTNAERAVLTHVLPLDEHFTAVLTVPRDLMQREVNRIEKFLRAVALDEEQPRIGEPGGGALTLAIARRLAGEQVLSSGVGETGAELAKRVEDLERVCAELVKGGQVSAEAIGGIRVFADTPEELAEAVRLLQQQPKKPPTFAEVTDAVRRVGDSLEFPPLDAGAGLFAPVAPTSGDGAGGRGTGATVTVAAHGAAGREPIDSREVGDQVDRARPGRPPENASSADSRVSGASTTALDAGGMRRPPENARPAHPGEVGRSQIKPDLAESGQTSVDPPKPASTRSNPVPPEITAHARTLGREGGKKGGPARAAKLSAEERRAISVKGGKASVAARMVKLTPEQRSAIARKAGLAGGHGRAKNTKAISPQCISCDFRGVLNAAGRCGTCDPPVVISGATLKRATVHGVEIEADSDEALQEKAAKVWNENAERDLRAAEEKKPRPVVPSKPAAELVHASANRQCEKCKGLFEQKTGRPAKLCPECRGKKEPVLSATQAGLAKKRPAAKAAAKEDPTAPPVPANGDARRAREEQERSEKLASDLVKEHFAKWNPSLNEDERLVP